MPKQVLLLIRHDLFRQGLKYILAHCYQPMVIKEITAMSEALNELKKKPDKTLLIIDSKLKEGVGLEVAATILSVYPRAQVLLVTDHKLTQSICEAMAGMGIKGYLHHDMEVKDYHRVFNCLLKGKAAFFT